MTQNPFTVAIGEGGFQIPVAVPSRKNPFDITGTAPSEYEMLAPGSLHFTTLNDPARVHGELRRRAPVPSLASPYQFLLNQVARRGDSLEPGLVRALLLMGVPGIGKTQLAFFLGEVLGYRVTIADCTNQSLGDLLVETSIDGHTTQSAVSMLVKWLDGEQAVSRTGAVIVARLRKLCDEMNIPYALERDLQGNARVKLKLQQIAEKEFTEQNDPLLALNRFAQENNLLSQQLSVGLSKKDGPLLETLVRANSRGAKVRSIMDNIPDSGKRREALEAVYREYGAGDVICIDEYTRRLREGVPHELYSVLAGTTTTPFSLKDAEGNTHIIENKNLGYGNFFAVIACNTPNLRERSEMLPPSDAVRSRFPIYEVNEVSAADFTFAAERALLGVPISDVWEMYGGADALKDKETQAEFTAALWRDRQAGLTPEQALQFTRLQQTHMENWADTKLAAERIGHFYAFWRNALQDESLFQTVDDLGNPRTIPEIDNRNVLKLLMRAQRGAIETIPLQDAKTYAKKSGNVLAAPPEEIFGDRVVAELIAEIDQRHSNKKLDADLLAQLQAELVRLKIIPGSTSKAKTGDAKTTKKPDERLLADLLNAKPHISISEELREYQLLIAAAIVARNHRHFEEDESRRIKSIKPAKKGSDPFDPANYDQDALQNLLPLHAVQSVLQQYGEAVESAGQLDGLPVNVRPGLSLYAAMYTQGKETGDVIIRPDKTLVMDPWQFDKLVTAEQREKLEAEVEMPAELAFRQGLGMLAAMPGGNALLKSMLFSDAPIHADRISGNDKLLQYQQILVNRSPYGVGVTTLLVDESSKQEEGLAKLQDTISKNARYYNPVHVIAGPHTMLLVGSGDLAESTKKLMQKQNIRYINRTAKNAEKEVAAAVGVILEEGMKHHSAGNKEELVKAIKNALNARHTTEVKEAADLSTHLCAVGKASKLAEYLPVTQTEGVLSVMRDIAIGTSAAKPRKA